MNLTEYLNYVNQRKKNVRTDMQTVRKIYSPSMLYRAEIIKRNDGLYQAEIYT